jgi:hypothetical protein
MTALLSAILNFLTNNFTALKLVLYGLFTLILPVIIWNVFVEITEAVLDVLNSYFSGVNASLGNITLPVSQFGSLAVWLVSNLRLGEAITALISGLTIKITVDFLMRVILR